MKTKNIFLLLLKASLFPMIIIPSQENHAIERPKTPQAPHLPFYYLDSKNMPQDPNIKRILNKQYDFYTHQYHRYIFAWQKYQLELKAYNPKLKPSPLQQRQYYPWDAPAKNNLQK